MKPTTIVALALSAASISFAQNLTISPLDTVIVYTCADPRTANPLEFVAGPGGTTNPGGAITVTETLPIFSSLGPGVSPTASADPTTSLSSSVPSLGSTSAPSTSYTTISFTTTLPNGQREVIFDRLYEVTSDGSVITISEAISTSFIDLTTSFSAPASNTPPPTSTIADDDDEDCEDDTEIDTTTITTISTETPDPIIVSATVTATADAVTTGSIYTESDRVSGLEIVPYTVTPTTTVSLGTLDILCFFSTGLQSGVGLQVVPTPFTDKKRYIAARAGLSSGLSPLVIHTAQTVEETATEVLGASTITATETVTTTPLVTSVPTTTTTSSTLDESTATFTAPASTVYVADYQPAHKGINYYLYENVAWGPASQGYYKAATALQNIYDMWMDSLFNGSGKVANINDISSDSDGHLTIPDQVQGGLPGTNFGVLFMGYLWPAAGPGIYSFDFTDTANIAFVWYPQSPGAWYYDEFSQAQLQGSQSLMLGTVTLEENQAAAIVMLFGNSDTGTPAPNFKIVAPDGNTYDDTTAFLVADCGESPSPFWAS